VSVQSLLTAAAFLLALGGFLYARRVARRLERLTESYWELRYEYGQLRARVTRLQPAGDDSQAADPPAPAAAANFVPLSSLERTSH
jgi:hypothetical protein